MGSLSESWLFWALLSAAFAALTAIFAKIGVSAIDPDLATLIRTIVIAVVLAGIVVALHRLLAGDLADSGHGWFRGCFAKGADYSKLPVHQRHPRPERLSMSATTVD